MEKGRIIRDLISITYNDMSQIQDFIRSDLKWEVKDYLVTAQYLQEGMGSENSVKEVILGYLLSDFRRLSDPDIKLIKSHLYTGSLQGEKVNYNKIGNLRIRREILRNLINQEGYDITLDGETLKKGALFVEDEGMINCFKVFRGESDLWRLRKALPWVNSYYILETDLSMDLVYNLSYNRFNNYLYLCPRVAKFLEYDGLKFRKEILWRKGG